MQLEINLDRMKIFKKLINTKDSILYEASKFDRIWVLAMIERLLLK